MVSQPLDVWHDALPTPRSPLGLYVAVSGNTAAGKSSLIARVEERIRSFGVPVIGISERVFHHPYLRLMFANPGAFAFPIQLSFMLQRHLVLLQNLKSLGRTVIMERSHLDDVLFVDEHFEAGYISRAQRDAYEELAHVLHAEIPAPDILVLLNPDPEVSLARLASAEKSGERPEEFLSDADKARWVHRWHDRYVELHAEFHRRSATDPYFDKVLVIDMGAADNLDACVSTVVNAMQRKLSI